MDFRKLLSFVEFIDERLIRDSKHDDDLEKRILARTVKLNEEVGELCNEVLGFNQDQRDEKLSNYNTESLSDEFADVIITTLLLAKTMNIDVKKSLEAKIEKLHKRYS